MDPSRNQWGSEHTFELVIKPCPKCFNPIRFSKSQLTTGRVTVRCEKCCAEFRIIGDKLEA